MISRFPSIVRSFHSYGTFLSRLGKSCVDEPKKRNIYQYGRVYFRVNGNSIASSHPFRSGFFWATTASGLLVLLTQFYKHQLSLQIKTANCKRIDDNGRGGRSPLRTNTPAEQELFRAITNNDLKKVKDIIDSKEVDINTRHSLGWTFLQSAAVKGAHEIVQILLEAGADPDAIDEYSNAAQISFEKKLNYVAVFMMREEEFADFLSGNVSFLGSTALHYACLADSPETIRVLMAHHANPNLENEFGHKAFDYLKDSKHPSMVELIPEFTKYANEYEDYIIQKKLESRRKFPLEDRIREVIIGQEGAITTVAAAIRRKENGWTDTEHPLVFLFLGSSGIGKTELAKQVANYLHGDKLSVLSNRKSKAKSEGNGSTNRGFIRIDMSEYQEKHEVSKFIGSPPGYVGHEEGGQLTKALAENPNAVVLFDEVEKAHPDVLTIMLQLFDEGRLTDGKGRTIMCKDAIFIMTSNLASDEIASYGLKLRRESEELAKAHYSGKIINEQETENLDKVEVSRYFKDKVIRPILKRHFRRDEFLGRINEIVYFLPFSRSELHKLVTRELELWKERAALRHRITLSWDRNVIGVLANGYDVHYGARSIKYEVDRRVVNKLASAHENRLMLPGAKVHVVVSEDGEEFTFAKVEPKLQEATESVGSTVENAESGSSEEGDKSGATSNQIDLKLKLLIENPPEKQSTTSSGGFFNKLGLA